MRPIPHNFDEIARTHSVNQMKPIFGACNKTIRQWLDATGITPPKVTHPRHDMPGLENLAPTHSVSELAAHFGCSNSIVYRRLRELGIKPFVKLSLHRQRPRNHPAKIPAPENFREIAQGKSVTAIAKMFGRNHSTAARWFAEHGMTPAIVTKVAEPPPADFDDHAWTETNVKLCKRYNRSDSLITRWRRLRGIPAPKFQRKAPEPKTKPAIVWRGPKPTQIGQRDDSMAGRAADYLRLSRNGGWRINRCKADGTFDPKGDHWRVGHKLLTEDGLFEMASRKGWRAFDTLHNDRRAA